MAGSDLTPAAFETLGRTQAQALDFQFGPHPNGVAGWTRSDLRMDTAGTHFGFVHRELVR